MDVVVADRAEKILLVGECKWRNTFDESEAIRTLEQRADLLPGRWERVLYMLFSKRELSAGTRRKAEERDDLLLVCANDLYAVS